MQRNATWALSNLCRGKPQPNFASVAPAIPILARLIHSADNEVVIDATWALSYISDGTEQNIEAVINAGVAHRLVELLTHSSHTVQTPALRTVGNIVTGNDEQTQTILDLRALPILYQLLQSGRKALRKEACWTISNITAGNREQTNSVIKANLIPPLLNLLSNGEFDVKKEAAWAISNATSWKNPEQIRHLVNSGAIKPLCDLLKANDVKTIVVALEALDNILSVGEKIAKGNESNGFTAIVEEAEGIDRLEELQAHENHEIYDKAVKILERYFGAEEEDENLVPNVAANQQVFNFGGTFQAPVGGFSF